MLYKFAMSLIVMSGYMVNGQDAAVDATTTLSPSASPTVGPSPSPSTGNPSTTPSMSPSVKPTIPTAMPTKQPTQSPIPTENPTTEPTTFPTVPTASPTMQPSVSPTTTLSVYQNGELTVSQPCCGNATAPLFENTTFSPSNWQCNAKNKGSNVCSSKLYFDGSDNLMVSDGTVSHDGTNCDCTYTLNRFDFPIPAAESNETAYDEIEGNWPMVSSEATWGEDIQSAVDAAGVSGKYECHRLLVTACDELRNCTAKTKPAMKAGETQVAQTKLSQMWRDYLPRAEWTEDKTFNTGSTCFCLWLYDNCPEDTTTSTSTATPEGESDGETDNEDETDDNNESGASSPYITSVIAMFGLSFLSISVL